MEIEQITGELLEKTSSIESKAFTALIISDFISAETWYQEYYNLLRTEEEKLPKNKKYHKGTPLHNWGIALLNHGKIPEGFEKIILAYVEDVLNSPNPEKAYDAPAYTTLFSNNIIDKDFLKEIYDLSIRARDEERVPKNPEQIIEEYKAKGRGHVDLSASFTVKNTDEVPTINASNPTNPEEGTPTITDILKSLGPKEKLVFIGGGHRNIALLRGIRDIVDKLGNFKPVLVSDFPLKLNEHDKSLEFLNGCGYAIFEISISNGHLMEIERACDYEKAGTLKFVLLYQGIQEGSDPKTTGMLDKFRDHMSRYMNLDELQTRIQQFLPK